jgi:hypothetical protein
VDRAVLHAKTKHAAATRAADTWPARSRERPRRAGAGGGIQLLRHDGQGIQAPASVFTLRMFLQSRAMMRRRGWATAFRISPICPARSVLSATLRVSSCHLDIAISLISMARMKRKAHFRRPIAYHACDRSARHQRRLIIRHGGRPDAAEVCRVAEACGMCTPSCCSSEPLADVLGLYLSRVAIWWSEAGCSRESAGLGR